MATLTTVGFDEIQPLSPTGRLFTISLIMVGVVVVFDLFAVLEHAGIRHAKGLICARRLRRVNVYIALTARALNPELFTSPGRRAPSPSTSYTGRK